MNPFRFGSVVSDDYFTDLIMINEKQKQIVLELVKLYNQLYKSEPDLKKYSEYAITYHSTAIKKI